MFVGWCLEALRSLLLETTIFRFSAEVLRLRLRMTGIALAKDLLIPPGHFSQA